MFNILTSATSVASIAMAAALTIYPETGIITNVDAATDTVEVSTLAGEVFAFTGVEDWETGDLCSMLMDSKGTEEVTDDEIVRALYCGNIEQFITGDEPGVQITFSDGNGTGSGYWYEIENIEDIEDGMKEGGRDE